MLPLPGRPPVASLCQGPDDSGAAYWTFYWAVTAAQVGRWLPRWPSLVLDLSGTRARCGEQAAVAGHRVVEVHPSMPEPLTGVPGVQRLVGDPVALDFLADGSVDAVIAEDRMLSRCLATEPTVNEIARVLKPGGRVLLSVDSLMLGMAILAEQNYWAHLSDVPRAEVVLVPWPDGSITRCFWSDQLREVLVDAGLEVEWIKPRTVVSPSTAEHVLAADPRALDRLVSTELSTPLNDESVGIHLVASAIKPLRPR